METRSNREVLRIFDPICMGSHIIAQALIVGDSGQIEVTQVCRRCHSVRPGILDLGIERDPLLDRGHNHLPLFYESFESVQM